MSAYRAPGYGHRGYRKGMDNAMLSRGMYVRGILGRFWERRERAPRRDTDTRIRRRWVPACARTTEGDGEGGGSALSGWFRGGVLLLLPNGQEDADDGIGDQGVADVDKEEPEAATLEAVGGCVGRRDEADGH